MFQGLTTHIYVRSYEQYVENYFYNCLAKKKSMVHSLT